MAKRLQYSIRNIGASWLNQLFIIIFRFLNRMVFVRVLSSEYLGLSGLFSDVLALLSLAELGAGAAISYHLYKPLAEKDEQAIVRLMNLFRKVYTAIGVFVFVVGAALTPFLPYLIKEMPDIPHLSVIYLLFVADSAFSYFWAYKSTLLGADQHGYLVTLISICTNAVTTGLQIATLLLTGNYILYLALKIAMTVCNNFAVSAITDRRYPYLRQNRKLMPDKAEIRQVIRYTRAMMLHKVGSVAVNSTDNLIISKFVGLAIGGAYSNYVLLTTCLHKIVGEVFNAVGAGVGSMGATDPLDKQQRVFERLFFLNFWGYSYAACGMVCVSTPLVALCFGETYQMDFAVPVLLSISFYLTGMRKTVQTFNSSLGLLRHNRYMPVAEAALNLIASIWLAQRIGLPGVILGTIISIVALPIWLDPYVLFHFHFQKSSRAYIGRLCRLTALAAAECAVCWFICVQVQGALLVQVLWRLLVCTVVCNMCNILLFRKTEAFSFYCALLGRFVQRLRPGKTKE